MKVHPALDRTPLLLPNKTFVPGLNHGKIHQLAEVGFGFIEKHGQGTPDALRKSIKRDEKLESVLFRACASCARKAVDGCKKERCSAKFAYDEIWDVQRRLKNISEPPRQDFKTCI